MTTDENETPSVYELFLESLASQLGASPHNPTTQELFTTRFDNPQADAAAWQAIAEQIRNGELETMKG